MRKLEMISISDRGMEEGSTCIGAVSCDVPNPACVNDLSSALTFPAPKQAYKLPLETRWKFGFAAH